MTNINLNKYRQARGMTWAELAETTGIDVQTLYRWNRGDIDRISLTHLDALCTVLRVHPGDLLQAEVVTVPLGG